MVFIKKILRCLQMLMSVYCKMSLKINMTDKNMKNRDHEDTQRIESL